MGLLPRIFPRTDEQRQADFEQSLLRREAKIGGQLFGPLPKGHERQFFCLDEHTWIWHEEWVRDGKRQVITTRYDVRPNGVIKSQDGRASQYVQGDEARNLYRAVELYQQRVDADYQRILRSA
ncbi:MAG: hypothetical protein JWO35_261 [Candidatus Saccharibacteria bacterium]|nr:hypothetical protein [Candidatus Saccharibacteria bacterium]